MLFIFKWVAPSEFLTNAMLDKIIYTDKNPSSRAIVSYGPLISGLSTQVVNPETLEEVKKNEI